MPDAQLLRFPDGEILPLPTSPAARVTQWFIDNAMGKGTEGLIDYQLVIIEDGFEITFQNVKVTVENV